MPRRDRHQLDKALHSFDEVIKTGQGSDILPEVYFQKGSCLFLLGNENWAEEIFLKAIKDYKDTDISLNIFMFMYDKLTKAAGGEFSISDLPYIEKRYQFLVKNFPAQRPLLTVNTRVIIYRLIQMGLFDKALAYIGLLHDYFPNQTSTLAWGDIQKGDIFIKTKDYDRAEQVLKDAQKKYREYTVYRVMALDKLADLYIERKKYDQAKEVFKTIRDEYKEQSEFSNRAAIKLKMIENLKNE